MLKKGDRMSDRKSISSYRYLWRIVNRV